MATSGSNSSTSNGLKSMSTSKEGAQNENLTAPKSVATTRRATEKMVSLDITRKDIAKVEVVDTDFVLTTKTGRKILIRDGALSAVTDEEFTVVFSDDESVAAKALFSESANTVLDPSPIKWSDAMTEETAALVAPAVVSSGVSYTTLGGLVLLAAAGGGGGGGGGSSDNGAAAKAALEAIGKFAQDNTESLPVPGGYKGVSPIVATYKTAGITGVTETTVTSINDALATEAVTGDSVSTVAKLQQVVNAYLKILNAANLQADSGGALGLPTADDYALIGVSGFGAGTNLRDARVKLLSDVIDRKSAFEVDTVKEIQALADIVSQVMDAAKGDGSLTKEQLDKLGITGVTAENLAYVIKAIEETPDDGTGVDTYKELQDVVDKAPSTAMGVITKFAQDNDDSLPTATGRYQGVAPTVATYKTAGVSGVTDANVASVNDALATAAVTGDSVSTVTKLQQVVTAYLRILGAANGQADTADQGLPTGDDYTLIGVKGLESSSSLRSARVKLLSEVIDRKVVVEVDTVKEIQALADIVSVVMDTAKGGGNLSKEQLDKLGITGVTSNNFSLILNAIQNTADDGSEVDTVPELQSIVDRINGGTDSRAALQAIFDFAQLNDSSQPIVVGSFSYKGTPPTPTTYLTAGVKGAVGAEDAAAFNDALATQSVTGDSVSTLDKLQAMVDAYRKVLGMADGIGSNTQLAQQPTLQDYQLLGVDLGSLQTGPSISNRLQLLNDIVDGQLRTGVDRIAEINQLIRIANAVQDQAAGIASNLTLADFTALGIRGLTSDNLGVLIDAIGRAKADGSDTVQELQNLLYTNLSLSFDAISEDRGYLVNDFITSDNTLTFSGSSNAADGTKIRLTLKRANQPDITLDGVISKGNWQVNNGATLDDGDYTVTAQLFDGNTALPKVVTFGQHVVVDTHADPSSDPDLSNQTIAITAIIDDTGASDTDFKTSDTTLIYKGVSTAADGTHVAVKIDGVLQWTTVQNGTWTLDNTGQALTAGSHTIEAYLADVAGNQAGTIAKQVVTIDTAGLTLLSKTSGPIGSTTDLVLKFSASVNAVAGKFILITDLSSPDTPWARIDASDATQVTIVGDTVTINPTSDLLKGHQYRAIIETGAFKTTAGAAFDGVSANAGWTLTVVDPSMEVKFAGNSIDFTDGINQAELASNALVVTGKISSTNLDVVTNPRITKIIFTSTDGVGSFELTNGLPTVDASFNWTLANNPTWTSQLVSGKTYTISAQLSATVAGTPITSVLGQSTPVLVDKDAPVLTKVECDKAFIKVGDFATYTFTFSEDPKDSFSIDDLIVAQVGNLKVGTFLSLSGTGNTRTALFRANDNVTFTPSANAPTVKVNAGSFKDAVGNPGVIGSEVVLPILVIDTQGPTVTGVAISGITTKTGSEITDGTLIDGDKVRVTVTMSEITQVIGSPVFNIKVGSAVRQATYVRGSGSNTLVFEYTVALGDSDNSGGITADAKSLSLGTSRISDVADNAAVLDTPAVVDNANKLVVVTTGASTALALIKAFAEANKDPANLVTTVAVPSVQDYKDAGVTGVTADNIDAINNALATAVIDAAKIPQLQDLQNLVTAYIRILALADSTDNVLNANNPNYLQYGLIGVQGVDSVKASLLGDVIDFKKKEDVDTVAEIQDLANAVSAVMDQARNVSGLTLDQLTNKLNIKDVTADNFAAIKRAIANTADDGSGVDTWEELQALVTTAAAKAAAALLALQIFADANQDSLPVATNGGNYSGTIPTWSTYTDAGIASIPGITDANLTKLVNDALATRAVTGSSISSIAALQSLVSAYGAIANLANGRGDTTDQPDATAYTLIGVQGLDPAQASSKPKASLLSDVIDRKLFVDIDTVKEIQALADAVSAVMANAAGTGSVTVDQLKLLGFDVPSNKIDAVVAAIASTPHRDGTDVDTFIELSNLINSKLDSVDQAIRLIANFADQNTISQPTPLGSFVYKGTAPTAATYNSVGLTGGVVTDAEAQVFNDALATSGVTYTSVDTQEEIQALVDAYRAVLKAADGSATATLVKPTLQQYGLLGVTGLEDPQDAVVTASRVSLLGDVIDRKLSGEVDTVLEIQALVNIVTRVMNQAKSVDGLTISDLNQLDIQGVTTDNFAAVLQAIRDTADNGTGVDTYVELQGLVSTTATKFNAALQIIQNYAKAHADPTQLGTDQPTVQTYLDLGIADVTSANVKSMNSALATASVTDQQLPTAQAVRNLVNAYNEILAAADGTFDADPIQAVDYTLLGITGVVGNDAKVRLLSDVIDRKVNTAVDTADELQALADKVNAVMNTAAKASTGGLTTAQQLTDLGVSGVTADNLAKVLLAIQGTATDGSGVDTVKELQDLVNGVLGTQDKALQVIVDFANLNTASQPLSGSAIVYRGIMPTRQTYLDAGVSGTVTSDDATSFNDALATNAITGSSVSDSSKLQALVDSYRKFFALADGPTNATSASSLTSQDCINLGVETSISGGNRLILLSDIVDRQARTGIDTIAKINQLVLISNAVQDQATGLAPSYTLTADDFTRLGVRGVSSNNLNDLLTAIRNAGAAGSDTVPELQNLLFDNLNVDFKAISDDTGASNNDFVTSDNTLTFSGTSNAADGTKIRISLKLGSQTLTLDGSVINGQWQVSTANALSDGDYTVSAQLFDGASPLPKVSTFAKHVMIDTSAVNRPDGSPDTDLAGKTVSFTTISADTGVQGDYKTSDTTLIFSGTSTAATGTNIGISIDGGPLRFTKVLSDGTWQFDNTQQELSPGTHTVAVYLTDAAGNKFSTGDSHNVVIDTTALRLVSQTSGPIASSAKLLLTFNSDVVSVAGKFIHLTDESTGSTIDISVKDAQVAISGATVTLNLAGVNQLEAGKTYHATVDADAFRSTAGASFDGFSAASDWRFQTVDPTTTITLGGTGVDASNGINASEVGSLTISGVATSPSWVSVNNPKITKLTFTSTDGLSTFDIVTNLTVNKSDGTWTLPTSSWSSQLVSNKTYTVKAQLESDISGTHLTSVISNSTSVVVDTSAPGLTIASDASQLAYGQTALITFTFDEVPVGFTLDDISVPTNNGNPIGILSNFRATSDPKIYTVVFTPVSGITVPSTSLVSVAKGSYTDAVGNSGKSDATSPAVLIDTQGPSVTKVVISGADNTNANKAGVLDVGDKIKITLTMSEVTTVGSGSTPIFSFDLGGVTKVATYASGSGSNTLVFYYTIARGDNDSQGGITATADSLSQALLLDRLNNTGRLSTPAADANTIVVDTTDSALNALAKAAQDNTASSSATPLTLYQNAGVVRTNANNLDAYNSALNSAAVAGAQADTTGEVQDIIDAYNTILNLADGGKTTSTFATDVQYQLIGVTGLDNPTTVLRSDKAQLLSDAIDRKSTADVDTVPEVQALADAVIAVMKAANGVISGAGALTRAQLEALGVQNLTDTNMPAVLAAIAATADDGTAVNTVAKLQALVDKGVNDAVAAAIAIISNFAADNTVSSTTGAGATFAYAAGSVKPQLKDYITAGINGVTSDNIDAINDALATASVDRLSTNTASGIQKVVDAYTLVFVLADGTNGTSGTPLQAAQLRDIGATIGTATDGSSNLKLLNSVLDFKVSADVDTVQEINTLSAIINAIMDSTGGRQASSANLLTAANLTKLGLGAVTEADISGILASIAAQSNGANIDLQGKLQSLVNFYVSPAPTVTLVADTGVNTQDGRTNNASLTFGAPSFSGATTYVSIDGGVTYVLASAYKPPTTSGTYNVLVRQVSAEGFLGQTRSLTLIYDATAPDAIKLNASGSTDVVYYGASDFGKSKFIAPNVQLANDGDVALITLSLSGASAATDRITYQSGASQVPVSLSADAQFTSLTIGGVTGVNLKYTVSSQTFEFSSDASRSSRVFSNAEVQAIERALGFTTSSQTTSSRTFKISHTDVAGNSNAATGAATVTLNIDNTPPNKILFSSNLQQEAGFYNELAKNQGLAVAIAANLLATTDTDVAKVQLTIGGAGLDLVNDRVVFGDGANPQSLSLGADASGTGLSVGGVTGVNWNYTASTKTLIFSLSNNAVFNGTMLQNLETSLKFQIQSAGTNITQGARTFTFDHIDLGGLSTQTANNGATKTITVDTSKPVDPDVGAATGTQRAQIVGYGNSIAGTSKALMPSISAPGDSDISTISVAVGGPVSDALNDKLVFGTQSLVLNTTAGSGTVTIGGVSVDWAYSTGKVLTFTKTGGGAFSSANVQAIEQALSFQTAATASQGDRSFTITHADQSGNVSNPSTVTVTVDYLKPSAVDLNANLPQVQNTGLSFYNLTNAGSAQLIAPNMATGAADSVAFITVQFGSVDAANDKLSIGGQDFALNTTTTNTLVTVQGIQISVSISGASVTLRATNADGSGLNAQQVQLIESNLGFKTTSSALEGDRTFTISRTDIAGNVSDSATQTIRVDYKPPAAIDLDTDLAGVNATALQYFNQTIATGTQTVLIAPKMAVSTDTDIARISVVIGGAGFDPANDQFLINGFSVALNTGDKSLADNPVAGVSRVTWTYNSTTQTFTFTKALGGSFSASEVQTIERALAFKSTANSQGNRTFTFTHSDQAGNASATAAATINVDTIAPGVVDLDDSTAGVQSTSSAGINVANLTGPVAIAPKVSAGDANDGVSSIRLTVSGGIDANNDQLILGATTVGIGITDRQGVDTIGGITGVVWSYSGSSKTFTFSKASGILAAAEVQAIERALSFKSTANATTGGSRAFALTHMDLAGNISATATATLFDDLRAPLIFLGSASAPNYSTSTATPTTQLALAASNATVSEDDKVASLQIRVRGLHAGSAEQIVVGTTAIDASGSVSSGSVSLSGNNWNWRYNNVLGAFAFSLANASATAAQTQDFLRNLFYKSTVTSPGEDVRQFFIAATDAAGNTGAEVVSSLTVNAVAPLAKTAATLDGNNDKLVGDQFVMTFNEPVKVSSLLDTTAWTITGGNLGTTWTARAVDSVMVNGEAYATNFLVTTGSDASVVVGPLKALTFTGSVGGSSTYSSQGGVSLPTFTLTSKAITMEAWVNVNYTAWPADRKFQRIFDFGTDGSISESGVNSGTEIWFGFNGATGQLAFEYINTPSGQAKVSQGLLSMSTSLPTNSWQHVAVTYSGTTATIYLNGVLAVSTSNFLSSLPNSVLFDNNFIGKSNWIADGGLTGSVYDARVYTNARSAVEISNDYKGLLDPADPKMLFQYDFSEDTKNRASGTDGATISGSRDATVLTAGTVITTTSAGTTITVKRTAVVDAAGVTTTADQIFQLYKKSATIGSTGNESITGTASNDFIAGQGGNDTLTGGAGADTFAWFLGETGLDTVTDFRVSQGDMADLSGILKGANLGPNNSDVDLGKFLQLTKSGNNMVLKIDTTGGSFATTTSKTITFIDGALNGLDDNLVNLVKSKIINLNNQTSTPLIFDLNGDGVHTLSVTRGVAFDIQGDGQVVKTGWVDGKDGLLVLDLNHDGQINSGRELFGSGTKLANGSNAKDGFEALQQYDLNLDQVIDAKDDVFNRLQLWVDANHDGVTDKGELHALSEFGVQSIRLSAENGSSLDSGNLLGLVSKWTDASGKTHDLSDVWFNTTQLTSPESMGSKGQKVDLTSLGKTSYDLHLSDVLATNSKTVVITADANDVVQIDRTGWSNTGLSASINNHVYTLWENGSAHLLIDQVAQVHTVL